MNTFKRDFEKICQEYHLVGASLEKYDNGKESKILYGMATDNTKVSSKTVFRIASISKVIVAFGAMKLVELHKLDLDADISRYLGFMVRNIYFPEHIITTRMLMTQTSSITDGFDDDDLTNEIRRDGYNGVNGTFLDVKLQDLLVPNNSVYYSELTFDKHEPGSTFIYSNFGCGILACIIEHITGEYFTDYIHDLLFTPLKIDASFRVNELANFEKVASTYIEKNGEITLYRTKEQFLKAVYPHFPIGENFRGPAGGLFINIHDLGILMQLIMNRGTYKKTKIFEPQTIEKMFETNWEGTSNSEYRAKGLQMIIMKDFPGYTLYGHFGSAYGVRSFMLFDKDYHKGLCFITNGGNDKYGTLKIPEFSQKILELFTKNGK